MSDGLEQKALARKGMADESLKKNQDLKESLITVGNRICHKACGFALPARARIFRRGNPEARESLGETTIEKCRAEKGFNDVRRIFSGYFTFLRPRISIRADCD